MKPFYVFTLLSSLILLVNEKGRAQPEKKSTSRLFRLYEDNDFINIRGKGTDRAYTNGTRLDLFYTKEKKSGFFIDRIMPKAGDSSIIVFGWGVTQLMFTPTDITKKEYQPDDYPYSGALFASHTLYSYNPVKKYSLQSEIILGVRGPSAFAKPTQIFIHRLINYQRPMGWDNQLKNKAIANISLGVEKALYSRENWLEIIAGAQLALGTMFNSFMISPTIRIGKMNPYFKGFISQYSTSGNDDKQRHFQAYFIIKPMVIFDATNGLLKSGINQSAKNTEGGSPRVARSIYGINGGVVIGFKRISLSYTQNVTTGFLRQTYNHEVGNVSLYLSW